MATAAVFIALGGSSYAAVKLKANSVRSKHIKNGQVRSPDVRNASLLALDFAPGQLPKGDKGDPGDPGSAAAYGSVNFDGTPFAGYSKNVNAVAKSRDAGGTPQTGIYCVDVAVPVNNVVATLDSGLGQVSVSFRPASISSLSCANMQSRDFVVSSQDSAGALADRGFNFVVN